MRHDATLDQLLNIALPRLEKLWQSAVTAPEERETLMWESLDQLSDAFEELHVAMEELQERTEELEALNQSLAAECRRYHDLFDSAPGGYLVTDMNGIIQQANKTAVQLLNMPANRYLVGKPLNLFVAEVVQYDFYAQLSQLRTGSGIKSWKMLLQPYQSQPSSAICTVSIMQDTLGQPMGLQWLLQDIVGCKEAACL